MLFQGRIDFLLHDAMLYQQKKTEPEFRLFSLGTGQIRIRRAGLQRDRR